MSQKNRAAGADSPCGSFSLVHSAVRYQTRFRDSPQTPQKLGLLGLAFGLAGFLLGALLGRLLLRGTLLLGHSHSSIKRFR